jgi:hypothetical protein
MSARRSPDYGTSATGKPRTFGAAQFPEPPFLRKSAAAGIKACVEAKPSVRGSCVRSLRRLGAASLSLHLLITSKENNEVVTTD